MYIKYCSYKSITRTKDDFKNYQIGSDIMTGLKSFLKDFSDLIIQINYEPISFDILSALKDGDSYKSYALRR